MKRRYTVHCSTQHRQGTARWRVQDDGQPGAVGGYYFTTKAEAKEYADELEAAYRTGLPADARQTPVTIDVTEVTP